MCVHPSGHTVTPQGGSDWQWKRTDLNELWQKVHKVVRWNSSQALCRKLPHTKIGVPAHTQQHDVSLEITIAISRMNFKSFFFFKVAWTSFTSPKCYTASPKQCWLPTLTSPWLSTETYSCPHPRPDPVWQQELQGLSRVSGMSEQLLVRWIK